MSKKVKMWDIFVSSASEDLRESRRLVRELREVGWNPFLADEQLNVKIGSNAWSQAIDNALDESAAVIVIVSSAALSSEWVHYEWRTFHNDLLSGKSGLLVPICVDDVSPEQLPRALNHYQCVDLRHDSTRERGLAKLNDLLRGYFIGEEVHVDPNTPAGQRTVRCRRALKQELDYGIPERTESTLLLSAWNLWTSRSSSRGPRGSEALLYAADIISRFDFAVLRGVTGEGSDFARLASALGTRWESVTLEPGSPERAAEAVSFIYDTRRVETAGMAFPIELPSALRKQFIVQPFCVPVRFRGERFTPCFLEITPGALSSKLRREELVAVIEILGRLEDDSSERWRRMILIGNFYQQGATDDIHDLLRQQGFGIPDALLSLVTSTDTKRGVDDFTIAVGEEARKELSLTENGGSNVGVVPFFDVVYRKEDLEEYESEMGEAYRRTKKGRVRSAKSRKAYYETWRKHQMSKQFPIWISFRAEGEF